MPSSAVKKLKFVEVMNYLLALPRGDKEMVIRELSKPDESKMTRDEYLDFLLNAPVFGEEEVAPMLRARAEINRCFPA
ncbi:MAG: hypothetical protein LBP75_02300 [Planctomycetota bacterium]|jgi:hypothetical protein|nr:hypothetical protein [Planctomycetota bacterium]